MPIYMDRHQIEGITRQQVADDHMADIKVQDKYGVNFMTYWFDEERDSVFCLVDAPNMSAVRKAHDEAHKNVYSEIIEVEADLVHAFLGRLEDPSPASGEATVDSAFRVIMFTDLEGSTQMISALGDDKSMELLRLHNALTRDALRAHSGREIKHTGDGFMTSFTSAVSAVECAIDIQKTMAKHNEENPTAVMHLRIGINAGEPVRNDNQLYGAAVNLAARLCAHAKPGSIVVARVVRELSAGKKIPFVDRGKFEPKGFDRPMPLFEVAWNEV